VRAVKAMLGIRIVITLAALASVAHAEPRTVALAPLTALGTEDTSASAKAIQGELETALGGVENTAVISTKAVLEAIKKAKKPQLRVCEGDPTCLAELGKLVGADLVVAGEAGGLGDVQVVYLELIDVSTAKGVRSTTLEVGNTAEGGAPGAAYRLLAPDQYTGTMTLELDTAGATVYVDGKKLGKATAGKAISFGVGTHALRVTHPEFHDFVRFVDVGFHTDTQVPVSLKQYPIVSTEMTGTDPGQPGGKVTYIDHPTPWYRKWWAIAAFSGIIVVGAAATAGLIADGVDSDTVRPVGP